MRFSQKLALQYTRTKFRLLSAISKRRAAEKAFLLFCTPQYRNEKPLPPIFEEAGKINFSFEQYSIAGYRWNKGAEKKVLLVHGFESSVVNFAHLVKPLMQKGYEVLAFDAPAHGRSSGRSVNVVIYKNFIEYILKTYGPVQSFIAHSLGGLTLGLVLEEWPHDEGTKLVLIAPAVQTTTAMKQFFSLLQLDKGVQEEFEQLIERLSGHRPEWFSLSRSLHHIHAQILFFQDEDDAMTPISDVYPLMQQNHRGIRFVISKGLGHRRIYRDAKNQKALLQFL